MKEKTETRSRVVQSMLTQSYYYVPRAKMLGNGSMLVLGKKVDVTADVKVLVDAAVKDAVDGERERVRKAAKKKAVKASGKGKAVLK